jgi:cytoplasmic iron level regulating protein YaaA (DUF328/UPF0246 family)
MTILFAPSEAKRPGGDQTQMRFCVDVERDEILREYDRLTRDPATALPLFGTKEMLEVDIFTSPTLKAVRRYTGVAYEHLDYDSLDAAAKEYIDRHLIIFSNLFGPLCADDLIPFYKLKQGAAVGEIRPERYYKERLADFHPDDEILDLRAGYYEKFYKPPYSIKMKFVKDGKVVSHWAKAYRGEALRQIAQAGVESFADLRKVEFTGLQLIEMQKRKDGEVWMFGIGG